MAIEYFTYGSNMNLDDLQRWCRERNINPVEPLSQQIAELPNFALVFNYRSKARDGGVLSIIRSENDSVCGVLYSLSEEDFEPIRRKEGKPYKEITVTVTTAEGKTQASTFQVRDEYDVGYQQPNSKYLKVVIDGANASGLKKECIDKILAAAGKR